MSYPVRWAVPLAGILALFLGACRGRSGSAPPTRVLTYASPMWYEETGRYYQIAPDGRSAIYGTGPRSRLYDVATGTEKSAAWHASMEQVSGGAFEPSGLLARLGAVGGATGWYAESGGHL